MRKALVLGSVALAVLGVAVAGPASAANSSATFTLTGAGGLAVSAPVGPVNLGSAATGAASLSGQLGNITVTDTRGSLAAVWTTTVSSTSFVTGSATTNETVSNALVSYSSGAGTALAGQVGAMVPGVVASLAAPGVASTWAGVSNNTVTWNPTLTFALLPSQVAGTYTGTITHSVV